MLEIPVKVEMTREDLKKYIPAIRGILINTKEVSLILRVSERWVESHIAEGTFPFAWYPVGPRRRLCDSEDLNEWLTKIRVPAATSPEAEWLLEQRQSKKKEESAQ